MGKLLALDIGAKRIGFAVSDVDHTVAFPRETLDATPKEKLLDNLRRVVKEEGIEKIIIGLPLDKENEEGKSAKHIRKVGEEIATKLGLPVDYIDESGSTDEAMTKIPFRRDRGKTGTRDAISAYIILTRFLEKRIDS